MFPIWLIGVVHFLSIGIALRILGSVLPCYIVEYYTGTANLLLWVVVVTYFTLPLVKKKFLGGLVQPQNKAVLITGCDTGFGHFLAKSLDSKGYHVFASCLFPSGDGAEALRSCSKRIQVFGLDVTSDESVKEALKFVRDNLGTSELWALVNNAGIYRGFSTELSPMEDYVSVIDVNTLGMVRVTKAFLPLIRQFRGRIVNLTSIVGRLCGPHFTPYTMSKHAAAAFNDCLRREMEPWGVKVISVEPEFFKTGLLDPSFLSKHCEQTLPKLSDDIKADYGDKYFQSFTSAAVSFTNLASAKLHKVVDALEYAVTSEHPDIQYKPTRNIFLKLFLFLCENLPASIIDICVKILSPVFKFPTPKACSTRKSARITLSAVTARLGYKT